MMAINYNILKKLRLLAADQLPIQFTFALHCMATLSNNIYLYSFRQYHNFLWCGRMQSVENYLLTSSDQDNTPDPPLFNSNMLQRLGQLVKHTYKRYKPRYSLAEGTQRQIEQH
jgi:hypothetical protein